MNEKLRDYTCTHCGKTYQATHPSRSHKCPDCCMEAAYGNATQLHAHDGPAYDKWRKSMKAAARRL